MQESDELILKRSEMRFEGNKAYCPKCATEDEVILANVTLKKFECLRCKIKFSIAD